MDSAISGIWDDIMCQEGKGVGELAIPGKDGKFADEEMIQGWGIISAKFFWLVCRWTSLYLLQKYTSILEF